MLKAIAVAAALCLSCASAFAQTAGGSDQARQAEAVVVEVVREAQVYAAIVEEVTDLTLQVMDYANESAELAEAGATRDEVKLWTDSWIPERAASSPRFGRN